MKASSAREEAQEAARFIASQTTIRPSLGLILGSGWGSLAEAVAQPVSLAYPDIPHFPKTTVEGHSGRLILGSLAGRSVALMSGRPHLYEGYSPAQVAFPVLVLKEIGVQTLILTNAAGALNPDLKAGDFMLVADHISFPGLAGISPLAGGANFLDMRQAYDPGLRDRASRVAAQLGLPLRAGVYAMVAGPSYETPAEARLLRALGADAVGMSTVPEVLAARQTGLRVLALSLIANQVLAAAEPLSHQTVLAQALAAAPRARALLEAIIGSLEP